MAWIYSFWFLGYVALMFGNVLVERYQGTGFLLYAGLLARYVRVEFWPWW